MIHEAMMSKIGEVDNEDRESLLLKAIACLLLYNLNGGYGLKENKKTEEYSLESALMEAFKTKINKIHPVRMIPSPS